MVIFSVVVLSLVGLSLQVARHSTRATDQALSMAVMLARVDRASTINYDSLSTIARCDTTRSGVARIIACVTADSLSNVRKRVRVIVRTTIAYARPDTVTFERGRVRYPIPLR